jgi:hypothetical protein
MQRPANCGNRESGIAQSTPDISSSSSWRVWPWRNEASTASWIAATRAPGRRRPATARGGL